MSETQLYLETRNTCQARLVTAEQGELVAGDTVGNVFHQAHAGDFVITHRNGTKLEVEEVWTAQQFSATWEAPRERSPELVDDVINAATMTPPASTEPYLVDPATPSSSPDTPPTA